jgi:hypothetical protein
LVAASVGAVQTVLLAERVEGEVDVSGVPGDTPGLSELGFNVLAISCQCWRLAEHLAWKLPPRGAGL